MSDSRTSIFSFSDPSTTDGRYISVYLSGSQEALRLHIDVDEYWLSNTLDLGDNAFKIKSLGQDYLEDFLDVY